MKKFSPFLMIAALFLASLNLRPAINSVSPLLQAIRQELGMSAFAASLLTSIPVLCMGVFSPLAVRWGRRKGIERVIGWSLAVIGIGNALRIFANSTWSLLLTSFIAGVGIAVIGPLLSGFIKQRFPANVPAMISVYTIALALGATLASGLSVPLQARFHSWQIALAVWAVLAVLALPLWRLSVARKAERPDAAAKAASGASAKLPWRNRKAWLLTLSFGLLGMLFYSVTAWLPPIVQSMGYSKQYAGTVLTVFSVTQIPVGLALPALLRRYPSRLFWLLLGSVLMLAGFVMTALSVLPLISAVLIGLGPGVLFPLNLMLPFDEAADAQQAAAWSAMTQSAGYIVSALGPIVLGRLHDAMGGSFLPVIAGMIAINVLMMAVQLAIVKGTVTVKPVKHRSNGKIVAN
ncbi:MFS transporter [Gordoniibacillus kamchatkensis]|uniref:MFS transporter n=1 Tax=Gordoniibacillus kamchatkensis TaxID=1590651 RepID=A0ABR5AD23_9BACL|nr:MFS transporter [Paenibacillus sp. VKM B-2647]KIL38941.1 MFS transporter [Paenibacillus sp. VKM B-2647]